MTTTTFVMLTTTFMIFLFLPILTLLPLGRKYGMKMPRKVAAIWWLIAITYYVTLFNVAPAILNHYWPLKIHKEMVCEVKTTYERKGL